MSRDVINGPRLTQIPKFPLNFQQTIFLPQTKPQFKGRSILIKKYKYENKKEEEERLMNISRVTNNFIVHPFNPFNASKFQMYQTDGVFYPSEIQQMSLQTFICLHKQKNIPIQKQFLKSFAKMYDNLNKLLNKVHIIHGNIKPSNIMITFPKSYVSNNRDEINMEQLEWKLAELCINQKSQNKYYSKSKLIEPTFGSTSKYVDPKQNDYFSLGVILLEMATLDPIQTIHNHIANDQISKKSYIQRLKKSKPEQHNSNNDLLDFIKALLFFNPKQFNNNLSRVGGLSQLYHNYVDPSNKEEDQYQKIYPSIDYREYILNYDVIERFLTDKVVENVIKRLKDNIEREEYKCSEVLKYINQKFDPEDDFVLSNHQQLFEFITKYGKTQKDQEIFKRNIDSILFANYFTSQSHIHYIPIIMKIFKPVDLADCIIRKAINQFEQATDFFKDQTNSKDVWKADDMLSLFKRIQVPFSKDDIQSILRVWAPNNKEAVINSLKLEEFKNVFRDSLSPKKVQKSNQNDRKVKEREQKIFEMFKQLSRTQDNFVSFFRKMPGQNKWQVPIEKVREQIKKYYKFRTVYEQKQIISELLAIGRHTQNDRSIDYIKVLLKINIYEPIDLFRKVIVERINEDGIATIYKKYQKDQKGWSFESLQQFCRKEYLQFDQKYQKMFFNLLDKDDSGFINLKEFTFKLTGIKEFDLEFIIQTIKNSAKNDGDRVFEAFLKVDRDKIFSLSNPQELAYAFEILDDKLRFQSSHIHEIYNKFSNRKGKFDYLGFMRYFCDLHHIFMKSCKILIETMYKGEFQKFYKIGLKGDQKKWKRQSLGRVNDMLVLGFKDKELDEVWKKLDSNDEISLSIQQIGQKFNKHVESFEEFKAKPVESLNDFRPKRREQQSRKTINDHDRNRVDSRQQLKKDSERDIQNNELVLDLKAMKIRPFLVQSFKRSQHNCTVWVQCEKFCSILNDQRVSCSKKFLENNFSYCIKKTSTKHLFNYLKFFLLIAQFKKDPLKEKTDCLRYLLNNFCSQKKIKANQIFEDFRVRDQMMKLSKFQQVLKDILEVADEQLFFEDINDVWIFIGDPQFIYVKDLQKILDDGDSQRLRDFVKNQNQQKSGFDSRQRPTPTLRNRQQNEYDRNRKQSSDLNDIRRGNMNQRERDDKYENNNRGQRDSQSEWRNTQMQRKRSDYDREKSQRDRNRGWQQQRQRQKSRQRARQRERQEERQRSDRRRQDLEYQRNKERENNERMNKASPQKRTSMQDNLYNRRQKPVQLSKKQLILKFQKQLDDKSPQELTRLFMDKNKITKEQFSYCLNRYYDFQKKQAEELSDDLADFGHVKIETIKKYLRPTSKDNQRRLSKDQSTRYGRDKQRNVQFTEKSPQRNADDRMVSPVTRAIKPQHKLPNPHKRKLNAPLIKEQIKMLVRSFSQRYALQQIDKYFFDDSDIIYRDEFIKKCKAINTTLNEQNLDKIFEFLKPNERQEVSIMNFKISFSFDDNMQVQQDYLPKELIKELQDIFNAHDKDKSGSIQPPQIQALLATLGFNETQKQIENVFQKIDKNFDNLISFSEFKDFIQDFILPHLIQFQNDVDELFTMLKMNDIFNTGCVSLTVLLAIIQRFGVKLTNQEGVFLAKYIGNEYDQIPIYDFLAALYYSSNPMFPPVVKSALYKIKLRRKISLKQIQKTFSNISSNFVMAYTSRLIKSEQLKRSSAFQPILHESYMFFQDFFFKDFRRIQSSKNDQVLVDDDPRSTSAIVEIRIPEASGVPIPQNSNIKGSILKRVMNVSFFDMSAQNAKHCIITLEAQWDSEIEDQWLFDMKNRAFYLKIANYDAKKFEKMILLFELVIMLNDNGRIIDVSCGSASISLKQLVLVENKFSKKLKLMSGIPTKSKEIDKVSVTKRSGWKSFLGSSNVESQLSVDIINKKNIDTKKILPMLYAMPSICLLKRKSLHYIWAFQQYFAQRCVDKDCINPEFANHHTVRAFLLSLDIEDISNQIVSFWRDKIEQNLKTVWQSRVVMYQFLTDLHMIMNSKQFELKMSNPCASVVQNKNLFMLRQKMVNEVMENIENYVKNELSQNKPYKRVKNYNYNYSPMAVEYGRGSLQTYINENVIKVGRN